MSRKLEQACIADEVRATLKNYRGLTVTVHAVLSKLRDAGYTVTRETIRKHLKDSGCIAEQRGLYTVPLKITKPTNKKAEDTANESANTTNSAA